MKKPKVYIIGGGAASLFTAYFLSPECSITIFEKEKSIGQKFLVAGKGGFNITNTLTRLELAKKYTPFEFMKNSILNFDSNKTKELFNKLGIEIFVGTSGRVFVSKNLKPAKVLTKIKNVLKNQTVEVLTRSKFVGFDENKDLLIENNSKISTHNADYYIFALGGASWSVTGSDGKWRNSFEEIGIKTLPFEASNCGVNVKWKNNILHHYLGKPLKNIAIRSGNKVEKGEIVITEYGLEGTSIYPLVPKIRGQLKKGKAQISIDLKPNNSKESLLKKLKSKSVSSEVYKKELNVSNLEMALLKNYTSKDIFLDKAKFVEKIKSLQIEIISLRPIEEAISTVGGIATEELNNDFSLKKYPKIFTIGEMVNWDAPTGGFLLQGCFSMAATVAKSILKKF
ncbi:MAG: aminoacetone oxidase family FAD-binding enzyme [Ignavibacteriae bacterium]|nr:MAG: aminoacetone oxidase family FAD-binding enzyme [Ignavibacteriota bacterium]